MRQAKARRIGSYWQERGAAPSWHPRILPTGSGRLASLLRHNALRAVALLLLLPAMPHPGFAETGIGAQQSGSLLLRMKNGYRVATRLNSDIGMQVSGLTARVAVSQVFRNDGPEWVEGVYVFPLPEGAAVDRLRMISGERVVEGEIREKEQAEKEYETAKREGRKASLVGQQRSNLFTTAVANIGPGETITIEIGYLDTVDYDDGTFSLRFPMTLTPRYIPGTPLADRKGSGWSPDTTRVTDASLITPPVVTRSSYHKVTLDVSIDAGMALAEIASPYHPIDVERAGDRYTVTLASSDVVSDHDLELTWTPQKSAAPRALQFVETIDGQPHLMLMLMPPDTVPADIRPPPRELVFVIDTSGSMHGVSLAQAKRAASLALDGLRPEDRFNVIEFNSVMRALYPHSMPADAGNVRTAQSYIEHLSANGGTDMRPALLHALSGSDGTRLRQIVFVTDGAVGNEYELYSLIQARLGDSRLFTVGIGSAPNGWFMRKAAAAGRGTFVLISALHEVEEKMARLLRRIGQPQMTDIEVQWPASVEVDTYPARVPDLYSGEPVIVKARLSAAPRPGETIVVRGDAPTGGWASQLEVASGARHPGIAALWARERIAALMDGLRNGGSPDEVRDAVVDTALTHGLVSKYTSLVAVDRTPSRPAGERLDREQVPNLLPYGQSQQAIFGFPATATVAPLNRLAGLGCVLLATLLLLFRVWTLKPRDAG